MNHAHDWLETLARSLRALFTSLLERVLGPAVHTPVLGALSWADLSVLLSLGLLILAGHVLAASLIRRQVRPPAQCQPAVAPWRASLFQALGRPLYFLVWACGLYGAASLLVQKLSPEPQALNQVLAQLLDGSLFGAFFWLCFRLTHLLEERLGFWASKTQSKLDDLVVPLLGRSLRVVLPVVGVILTLPILGLSQAYAAVLAKLSSILIIGAVAWILFQTVHLAEKATLARYDIKAADNLQARKVYTQVHILSKTLYFIIAFFTAASVLMLFEEVRRFGTSLLASAGILGVIVGFAAQRTIANLFAGFQLAMTQPIRLDDVVIVEGEWGRIEEITLTYVVVRIWDERRLIVPLSHFIEKPFQNWTRVSGELLGSIFIWVDYSLPLDQMRSAVQSIVETSPLWDRRFWNLQVTDTSEHAVQIRVLATAADSSKAWDLRCEIREKLIGFIQKQYPHSLPRVRLEWGPSRSRAPQCEPFAVAGDLPHSMPL